MTSVPVAKQPDLSRNVSREAIRGRLGAGVRGGGRLLWPIAVVLCLLVGCVTEYTGGTQRTSDPDATLDKRVALARQ